MGWSKIGSKTSEDYSEPLDGTGTNYPKVDSSGYLRSHYIVRLTTTAYQDSGNKNRYKVECKAEIANAYKYWGGVWNGSNACTLTFEFFDKNGDDMKVKLDNGNKVYSVEKDIDLSNLSCWDSTSGQWHTVTSASTFSVIFTTTETTIVGLDVNCHKGGAGRTPESAGKTLSNFLPTSGNQINKPSGESKVNATNYKKAKSSAGFHGWIKQGITISKFVKPTFKLVEVTKALGGGPNNHTFTIKYNLHRGSSAINKAKLYVMNLENTSKLGEVDLPKNNSNEYVEGDNKTFTFNLRSVIGNSYANETKYTVKIYIYDKDGDDEYTDFSATKNIVTYRQPTLTSISAYKYNSSTSVGNPATINARTGIKFVYNGANDCRWETWGESKFRSLMYSPIDNEIITKNTWANMGTNTWLHWDANDTRKLFPFNGSSNRTVTMHFKRSNSVAGWTTGDNTINVKVIYIPEQTVTNISYKKNSSGGSAMPVASQANRRIDIDSSYTGIYTSWDFDDTTAESGYIQGYRIELQYDNNGWTTYKTYYTNNKNYTIPIADVPRVFSSRIRITPYYANGQTRTADASVASNYKYASSTYQVTKDFFTVVSGLNIPTISLPKTNTTYHNKDFRVCFVLPEDPDAVWLSNIDSTMYNNYRYDDVQIIVTTTSTTTYSLSNSSHESIFSSSLANISHKRPLVIWANKLSSSTYGTYKIKVNVKKSSALSYGKTVWAESSEITINVNHPTYNPQPEDTVMAQHYKDLSNMLNGIKSAYNISYVPTNVTAGDKITSTEYKYRTIQLAGSVKSAVNDFNSSYRDPTNTISGAYDNDRTDKKFDINNQIKTSASNFDPKGVQDGYSVKITAVKSDPNNSDYVTAKTGANYIKWLYEQYDYLK